MKIIDFNEFSFEKYYLSSVAVIRQTNNWTVCSPEGGRTYNGFLLLVNGNCTYRWADTVTELSPGSLIYLPKGSIHSVTAPERSLDFYRINFTATDNKSFDEVIFSALPQLVTSSAPKNLLDICEQLRIMTLDPHTGFRSMSLLCELINYCSETLSEHCSAGIDAAVKYISAHYTEHINISELADMCFISNAHLFRLFKRRYGMSPIEFKNSLRIKTAEKLLCDPDCTIGEIASILGFENACYFTRTFKKYKGISPLSYRKDNIDKGKGI